MAEDESERSSNLLFLFFNVSDIFPSSVAVRALAGSGGGDESELEARGSVCTGEVHVFLLKTDMSLELLLSFILVLADDGVEETVSRLLPPCNPPLDVLCLLKIESDTLLCE